MFITRKRNQNLPNSILINGNNVEVVNSFKLLGITIDNKLDFGKYAGDIKLAVNKRMFSINKLFYLPFEVKLQFFKSFLLTHYDYCSTIYIYFPKSTIQKISNCYYQALWSLLNIKSNIILSNDFNLFNNKLENLGLMTFQHRLITRLVWFSYKLFNNPIKIENLFNVFEFNRDRNKGYLLRNNDNLFIPQVGKLNRYGCETFQFMFSKLINELCILDLNIDSKLFKIRMKNNINLNFFKFIKLFPKFDIDYNIVIINEI
jgi:hypothetical protein